MHQKVIKTLMSVTLFVHHHVTEYQSLNLVEIKKNYCSDVLQVFDPTDSFHFLLFIVVLNLDQKMFHFQTCAQ